MNQKVDLIVFGAQGDLSGRKLFPALYHLERAGLLNEDIRLLAVARQDISGADFARSLKDRLLSSVAEEFWSEDVWSSFLSRLNYRSLDFTQTDAYNALAEWMREERTAIFYLATPPGLFDGICASLGNMQCIKRDTRIVLEKPIGQDLTTCMSVNKTVARFFPEENIYRIDHYLGKETVQNLLVLRFANRFINTQWDQSCVDHVQITVAETVGIEGRWAYYDKIGQLRDMVQNHLMQLLCLVAMEPPNSMTAGGIRDEKIKILRALRAIDDSSVRDHVVRGQYAAGWYKGMPAPGYLQEEGCELASSETETFVAIKAFIDNWRWSNVPFYLRTGKRLPEKLTEIAITYKTLPHNIFAAGENIPNRLVIRLQPNEGIEMQMVSKLHSLKDRMKLVSQNLNLDFLGSSEMDRIPDAYERLFLDVINNDQSLFVGREEVEESWRWCDSIIAAWSRQKSEIKRYHAGTWGPTKAELLIEKDGRSWHGSS